MTVSPPKLPIHMPTVSAELDPRAQILLNWLEVPVLKMAPNEVSRTLRVPNPGTRAGSSASMLRMIPAVGASITIAAA